MAASTFTRRRMLLIAAAATAGGLTPLACGAAAAQAEALRWRGRVMGAEAQLLIHHPDRAAAKAALAAVLAEARALEAIFSLHRADSALRRLNAQGHLDPAPEPLRDLLIQVRALYEATGGAFDPTVQPLWTLHAEHFAKAGADPAGPSAADVAAARQRVGFAHVQLEGGAVRFGRPAMALTLNGIAQGYLTDRAHDILAAHGLSHTLINLGEYRALGGHPDGRPWRIGIADARRPWRLFDELNLPHGAIATSAGAAAAFDQAGRHHHLFAPASGRSGCDYVSVTVRAPTATLADGLSTALAVMPPDRAEAVLARFTHTGALLRLADGSLRRLHL